MSEYGVALVFQWSQLKVEIELCICTVSSFIRGQVRAFVVTLAGSLE